MEEKIFTDGEKVNQICTYFNLSKADFAQKLGVSTMKIYDLSRGQIKNFSRKTLEAIVKNFPVINPLWLITGEGSMLAGSVGIHQTASGSNSGIIVQQSGQDNTYSTQTAASADGIIASQQQTIERLTKQNEQQAEQINRLHGMIESLINKQPAQ